MIVTDGELRQILKFAYDIANRCVRNSDPELLSEAHTAVLHALDTFDASYKMPLMAWIRFIVLQRVRKQLKLNRRLQQMPDAFWQGRIDEKTDTLGLLLQGLQYKDQTTAYLYWVEDRPIREVAREIGESVVVTKARLARLRNELRDIVYG